MSDIAREYDLYVKQCDLITEQSRPSVLFKPKLSLDGNMWCALYGDDLQEGCAGFGKTPNEAMLEFDISWFLDRSKE